MSKINAVHVTDIDSCVTVTMEIPKGGTVFYQCKDGTVHSLVANVDIPIYHKIATVPVKKGEYVLKYGEKIGQALEDINSGDHVHAHNLKKVGYIEEAGAL